MTEVLERMSAAKLLQEAGTCNDVEVSRFLSELGELSRRHGLAITDGASLYIMEQEDYARTYLASDESILSFA